MYHLQSSAVGIYLNSVYQNDLRIVQKSKKIYCLHLQLNSMMNYYLSLNQKIHLENLRVLHGEFCTKQVQWNMRRKRKQSKLGEINTHEAYY